MSLLEPVDSFLGLGTQPQSLTFLQIAARGIIVFLASLMMVRLGDRRFLSGKTAFDVILGFILASMRARGEWLVRILGHAGRRICPGWTASPDCESLAALSHIRKNREGNQRPDCARWKNHPVCHASQ